MKFNDRLTRLRKKMDLTQEELGTRLGFSRTAISAWEIGRNEPTYEDAIKIANFFGVTLDYLIGAEDPNNKRVIPVLGVVKAGYDYLAQNNIITYIEPSPEMADLENYFGLIVKGDSMSPLFNEGDYLIVHKQDDFSSNDTCIILINGNEATVKKVVKTKEGIELHAYNPYYPIKKFTFKEVEDLPVIILGKVIKLIRDFK